jgi:plasminogen activator inhibitor 1 RNA-binding protein
LNTSDTEKQISQGWGAKRGDSEWTDEQAGEAIAKAEEKEATETSAESGANANASANAGSSVAPEPEPEDHNISYADYIAEQAEKRLNLAAPEARKPNEGKKEDKKWAQAKKLERDEEDDSYIAGAGGKVKRERQRKERNVLEIDQRFVEMPRGGREGGRGGGGRGRGEGRGEFRGDRGDRGGRGGRGGRGEGRVDRGRGDGYRGGRGAPVNVADTNAFPSLGS